MIDQLGPAGLVAALERFLRHDALAAGVFLRPPPEAAFPATRLIVKARRPSWGVVVRADRTDPRVSAVQAALATYAAMLRERSAASWRSIDAVREHGSTAGAAAHLGCSPQAVRKNLRAAHHRVSPEFVQLLTHLLHPT